VLGDDYVNARFELDFKREVVLGQKELVGRVRPERVGRTSVGFAAELALPDGQVALAARGVVVAWDREARRSRPLTDAERERLDK
jgi:acyl-CoA thioesterase FadM